MKLKPYTRVRVCKLVQQEQSYDGWGINQRLPQVGDVGYLLDILQAPGLPDRYVTEMSDPSNGIVTWLCTFYCEELEPATDERAR